MSKKKTPDISPETVDRIIRKVVNNSQMTKKEINEEAGIGPQQSRENLLLKPWIRKKTCLVFGKDIKWEDVKLDSLRGSKITPDLVGKDCQGRPIIVEIKFKFDYEGDANHLRRDPEDRSIGQILQYSCAYRRKYPSTENPHLFIVSIDFSKDVECVCEFLRSQGIDIHYIAIEKLASIAGEGPS